VKRIFCSRFKEFVWHGWYLIVCLLLSRLNPSELSTEVLAATGLDTASFAFRYSDLIKDNSPASTSNRESSFQQIRAAVGAWDQARTSRSSGSRCALKFYSGNQKARRRSRRDVEASKHEGRRTSFLVDNSTLVESYQTRPPSLPGATSTVSDLDCFVDFSAFLPIANFTADKYRPRMHGIESGFGQYSAGIKSSTQLRLNPPQLTEQRPRQSSA
jgi:hypothetical protein